MRSWIPNALTATNLICGMIALLLTLNHDLTNAAIFVVLAMIADGTDGRAARMLGVSSEFGKELDSLCDLVSFGVAPAIMAYSFGLNKFGYFGWIAAIFFAVCTAWRLARFNVNTDTVKGYFMGLPSPAAGCAVATFVGSGFKPWDWLFLLVVIIFGYLMVSAVKYPDFKGKGEKIYPIPAAVALIVSVLVLYFNSGAILFVPFLGYSVFGIIIIL